MSDENIETIPSHEPTTLTQISAFMKEIIQDRNSNRVLLEQLSSRIDLMESEKSSVSDVEPTRYLNNPKSVKRVRTPISKEGPSKKPKVVVVNKNITDKSYSSTHDNSHVVIPSKVGTSTLSKQSKVVISSLNDAVKLNAGITKTRIPPADIHKSSSNLNKSKFVNSAIDRTRKHVVTPINSSMQVNTLPNPQPDHDNPLIIDSIISHDNVNQNLENEVESHVDLDDLERLVLGMQSEDDCSISPEPELQNVQTVSDQVENDATIDLPIFGTDPEYNWAPSVNTMNWFRKVADIELTDNQVTEISDSYTPCDDIAADFVPPEIPPVFWNKMKSDSKNSLVYYNQRALWKSQKLYCLALKPLLSSLDNMEKDDPNLTNITTAVQLICSANLQTSRLRRASTAKFMKNDVKASLFAQPVTHKDLFGSDFESAADKALKSQNSSQKVLFIPKKKFLSKQSVNNSNSEAAKPQSDKAVPSSSSQFQKPSTSSNSKPFRNYKGKGSYRGKYGSYSSSRR